MTNEKFVLTTHKNWFEKMLMELDEGYVFSTLHLSLT